MTSQGGQNIVVNVFGAITNSFSNIRNVSY